MYRFLLSACIGAFFFLSPPEANAEDIPKKNEQIIILHGIARTSWHMKPLAKFLRAEGYEVHNLDYDSTDHPLTTLIDDVQKDIAKRITDDKPVHYIGYSMGGLVVRGLLNRHTPKNFGKAIQLAAPNHGSELADFLENNRLYKAYFGPAGQELTVNNTATETLLGPVTYPLGVVAGNFTVAPLSSYIIEGDDDGKVSIESTKVDGMADHIVVSASHLFFPSNDDVHHQTLHFLQHGMFDRTKR